MKKPANRTLLVDGLKIRIHQQERGEYINITDIAKSTGAPTDQVIANWIRNRNTLEYLALWEEMHNPYFNRDAFEGIISRTGLNSFYLSTKEWKTQTGAIGLEARAGRYGGTYAHEDIALEFCSYLNPKFRLYLVTEFKRLKEEEAERRPYELQWSVRRELSKVNYRLHRDAVKLLLPPKIDEEGERFLFQNEADLLNLALFGITATSWREANPKLKGNMRDHATLEQLTVLANLQGINAYLIENGFEPDERLVILNDEARKQMSLLIRYNATEGLAKLDKAEGPDALPEGDADSTELE